MMYLTCISADKSDSVLKIFHNFHPRIVFTNEIEINYKIDMLVN